MSGYEYIDNGYTGKMTDRYSNPVISPPEMVDEAYEDPVSKQTSAILEKIALPTHSYISSEARMHGEMLCNPDEIELLMRGTMHLIDTIIEQARSGDRFDTLVFLDKSARYGAYLLLSMWHELSERGEIPDGLTLPAVRYVNIGRNDDDKHGINTALQLLRTVLRRSNFEQKNVLIIDEIVATGQTLRLALRTFEEVFGIVPIGMAQFKRCPCWYGAADQGLLGVEDPPIDSYVEGEFKELNENEIATLYKLVKKTTSEEFSELVAKVMTLDAQHASKIVATYYINKQLGLGMSPTDFKTICTIMNKCSLLSTDAEDMWEYVHTAGGFMVSRIQGWPDSANHVYFRKLLKTMVHVYMVQRDLMK